MSTSTRGLWQCSQHMTRVSVREVVETVWLSGRNLTLTACGVKMLGTVVMGLTGEKIIKFSFQQEFCNFSMIYWLELLNCNESH